MKRKNNSELMVIILTYFFLDLMPEVILTLSLSISLVNLVLKLLTRLD